MDKLYLHRPIEVIGPDFWGTASKLVLEPLTPGDDRWMLRGKHWWDVPIIPSNFRANGRWVYIQVKSDVLMNEFEHVGFLYALGLRGVRVRLQGSLFPPFLPSAELYQQMTE